MKQTHEKKLAENLSPVTQNMEKSDKSTQKLGEVTQKSNSENKTPDLAIENVQTQPAIQQDSHPGILYDTSLEITSTNMISANNFFKIRERCNGDLF